MAVANINSSAVGSSPNKHNMLFPTTHHDVSPISTPSTSRRNSAVSSFSTEEISPISSPAWPPSIFGRDEEEDDYQVSPRKTPNPVRNKFGFSPAVRIANSAGSETSSLSQHSCSIDTDDWFGRFREDLDVTDELPGRATLAVAGEVPLFDVYGRQRLFKSFVNGLEALGDRQMIIFIRHFYCGACQAYLKALTESITMHTYYTMQVPTSIMVIGCGSFEMIPHYRQTTGCPFPIFADPSRQLFRILGMGLSANIGTRRPDYMKDISPPAWLLEQFRQMSKTKGSKKFRAGNWMQVGGEFLFQDGQAVWCHRMRNYRDHVEIKQLRRVLGIDT